MICIETQYFNLNKILLLAIGSWPYRQSKFARLQFIFLISVPITSILFQLTTFLTSKCTTNFVIKICATTCFFAVFVITYISIGTNMESLKELLIQLQYVYNQLKDENEFAIVERYSYIAKCYTVALTTVSIFGVSFFIFTQCWPCICDIIFPRNESRPRHLLIKTEYFIDQERYFFLIVLHLLTAAAIGSIGIVAVGTMLIAYLQHTCGMFKIASYRIERAVGITVLKHNNVKDENFTFKGIICAVDIHRQAMKSAKLVESKFGTTFFYLIIFKVISLSLNLFRVATENDLLNCLMPSLFVIINILCMFLANSIGQNIIDHNNDVFATVYNVQWYSTPLHIQRLILFLLQRAAKDFTICVGGLFSSSLQCFATLVNTSISYFTVIYSTQ